MVPLMLLVLSGGPIAMIEQKDNDDKPPVPASPVGKWEVFRGKGGPDEGLPWTLEVRDGKLLLIQPRDQSGLGTQKGFRIEAEYSITKSGRVYGCITSVFGDTNTQEGSVFSFIPTTFDGNIRTEDGKGDNLGGLLGNARWWKPKP